MTSEHKQVLIADDEPNLRRVVTAHLQRDGFEVHAAEDGQQAVALLAEHHIDVVITDLKMPRLDGMGVLRHVVATHPDVPVIMITAHGTVDTAVEALKMGAFDYVTKPFDRAEFQAVVQKAARSRELSGELYLGDGTAAGRPQLIGESAAMRDVFDVLDRAADSPSTVLISGESGTGKELVARALHENGARAGRPFIRVHCAAIPPEMIESELFGYQKGAFSGAVTSKPGRFELADGGTLFIDEIGELSLNGQARVLRALQEGAVERVGGVRKIPVDVRLIVGTHRDLPEEIRTRRFREDLYYALNVVQVALPPLRERREDIPPLVAHFLQRSNARLGKDVREVAPDALAAFVEGAWPGNIRELENVVERCVLFCDGATVTRDCLPPELRSGNEPAPPARASSRPAPPPEAPDDLAEPPEGGLKEAVREATTRLERDLILRALQQTQHNVTHAARLLKISRKSLQMKMKELALREDD